MELNLCSIPLILSKLRSNDLSGVFMIAVPRRWLRNVAIGLLAWFTLIVATSSHAGTIVRVSTSLGDYSIELLDDIPPATVQNFLNYVNRNDYNGTYLHRVVDSFVAQGGAYRFQLSVGPIDVATDPPVINEFNVSNTRGTVAMAKVDGDPDSATNQWFVNLIDNSANLDSNNSGFTVFGNVLGSGMDILDAINDLATVNLGTKAPSAPYFTLTYSNPNDFVYINVEVMQRFTGAPRVFESVSGLLITSVSLDGDESLISLNFNVVPAAEGLIIEANLESVIPGASSFDGIATISTVDNKLRIPSLEVNLEGSVLEVHNVVFGLSDLARGRFTLESYDQ